MDSSHNLQNNETPFVTKFKVKDECLYAKILWKEDSTDLFHIKIFYGDYSWSGMFTNDSALKRMERLDENIVEYNMNVKQCLTGNSKDYVYDFAISSDDMDSASFTWKKQYEGALKTHGVVALQRDETPESKDTLIDILLEQNKKLISDIEDMNKTKNDLQQDLDEYTHKLEDLVKSKTSLETTLYGQFVRVLNEKKKRIQLLQEHLKNYDNNFKPS